MRQLLASSASGRVSLWDAQSHSLICTLSNWYSCMSFVWFSPGGGMFVVCDDKIEMFDVRSLMATSDAVTAADISTFTIDVDFINSVLRGQPH